MEWVGPIQESDSRPGVKIASVSSPMPTVVCIQFWNGHNSLFSVVEDNDAYCIIFYTYFAFAFELFHNDSM